MSEGGDKRREGAVDPTDPVTSEGPNPILPPTRLVH